jgi:hypothetical protein
MSTALVLGERGSGLTTFVGLLYTAQVRLGSEEADDFRFSAERESLRRLGAIYAELGDGKFPAMDVDWEENPLSFVFGFRRGRFSAWSRRAVSEESDFDTVRFQVGGIPTEEVAELHHHDAVLQAGTRELLRSHVILPLVDASWLSAEPKEIGGLPMARYDRTLASTLDLLGKFLAAEQRSKDRRMCPVFIVTKFDRVRPEALRHVGAPNAAPRDWSGSVRTAVGQQILTKYLPATAKVLAERSEGRISIEPPAWYFSGLRTENRNGETRILRRERTSMGGWEPEYPFEEYRSLLVHLGELAHRFPGTDEA